MAIVNFPARLPASMSWSLQSNTQSFESPFNRTTQTVEMAGARWIASLQFAKMKQADARIMLAFMVSLRGEAGRFYLHDHAQTTPQGSATGTPVVAGASQTGASINTSGWTVSTVGILKAGDMIGIGGELKMVIADATSDAAGLATLQIEPPLRTPPTDLSAIITTKPTAIMRLSADSAHWSVDSALHYTSSIDCVEAF